MTDIRLLRRQLQDLCEREFDLCTLEGVKDAQDVMAGATSLLAEIRYEMEKDGD